MGKMILDDLRKRLERLDEDADLMIDNNDRYQMVIVGGSAFILPSKLYSSFGTLKASMS